MDATAPKTTEPYPLGNRVIHANIQSIEPDDSSDSRESTAGMPPNNVSAKEKAIQKKSSEMQLWWDEAIARNMNLPDGYLNVAVLIIKWSEELDELKTGAEVAELDALFREQLNYTTKIVELNVSKKPQHQLNRHLSTFVEEHDGPHNLMIVYYTGHGIYREKEKYLQLTATTSFTKKKGLNIAAQANWNTAEEALRAPDVDGDVLTILDTCFSSNIAKSGMEDTRTYELLSACGLDSTTASPGENSFTRALIDSFKDLLVEFRDRSFTTFHLNQKILLHPARRDTPSQLWYRLKHHERHIRLSPLKSCSGLCQQPYLAQPPGSYLTLRFALRDESLNQEQIECLTKHLSKAFNNKALVAVRRIDWMGIRRPARTGNFRRAALALHACAQWKKFAKRKRNERMQQHPTPEPEPPSPTPSRKRAWDTIYDGSKGCPQSKRKQLEIPKLQQNPNQDISPLTPPT
ncbi:hypothetical protein AOQ84DRAFT_382595 [Glonium stellatum]|uniref:Uncharacterized protein n=1 Tax=Glonium stellatum TaxID=574774 RepID=A0A8E2EPI6_9PEZI|nr:hypothetical protein AOQ84DRAFT_382595 [Glonium stellatum]